MRLERTRIDREEDGPLLDFLSGREPDSQQRPFDLGTDGHSRLRFDVANALELNRHVLLRYRSHFDGDSFTAAATPTATSGSGRCRAVAEKAPQHDQQDDQQQNTDDLNNSRAGLS